MPQMAPISWLTLFMLFSLLYVMFNILNYFSTYPSPPALNNKLEGESTQPFTWKW